MILDGVEHFFGYTNVTMNVPLIKEIKLTGGNIGKKESLEPRGDNFGYDFANAVAKGNREIMIKFRWVIYLRNVRNKI